jgi:hypothetical protein
MLTRISPTIQHSDILLVKRMRSTAAGVAFPDPPGPAPIKLQLRNEAIYNRIWAARLAGLIRTDVQIKLYLSKVQIGARKVHREDWRRLPATATS